MPPLRLSFACETYGHVRAISDGTVTVPGVSIETVNLSPTETFPRLVRDREFDLSEMGLTFYLGTLAEVDPPYIALPVFPSRSFRHSAIYVNANSGIRAPRDLAGKRLGETFCYGHDAGLWAKGLLADEVGFDPGAQSWTIGGLERPLPRWDWLPFAPPPGVRVAYPPGAALGPMLERGEIDGLFSAHPPEALGRAPHVRRLFADFEPIERDYFGRSGIFPIMHVIVVRRSIAREYPGIARALYDAFVASKRVVEEQYAYWEGSLHRLLMIPWVTELRRKNRELMGADLWPYGVEANRRALETALRYHHEQGLSARPFSVDELFAPETLAT